MKIKGFLILKSPKNLFNNYNTTVYKINTSNIPKPSITLMSSVLEQTKCICESIQDTNVKQSNFWNDDRYIIVMHIFAFIDIITIIFGCNIIIYIKYFVKKNTNDNIIVTPSYVRKYHLQYPILKYMSIKCCCVICIVKFFIFILKNDYY
jgi:hypothetical protein